MHGASQTGVGDSPPIRQLQLNWQSKNPCTIYIYIYTYAKGLYTYIYTAEITMHACMCNKQA